MQVIPNVEEVVSNSDTGIGPVIAYIIFFTIIAVGAYFFVRNKSKK